MLTIGQIYFSMQRHRWGLLVLADWLLVLAISCFFMWAFSVKDAQAQQDSLRDTVISSREKITSVDARVTSLEADQKLQWSTISSLKDDVTSVKEDVTTMLRFFYAILGAILVKGVIDMIRNKPQAAIREFRKIGGEDAA